MTRAILQVLLGVSFILTGLPYLATAGSEDPSCAKPVVIIDSGHTNKMPGAISVTGKYEVEYNDNLVSKISDVLTKAGFVPVLTRKSNEEVKLEDRADIANSHNALALLSIHHDSAQLAHLESVIQNGKNAYRTREPISGYSLFISRKNEQFDNSFIFAKLLGEELIKLGRKPALHHAEPIPGEGRPLLDADLGIYQYDDLTVLNKSRIPSVLLEVGVIVDQSDEIYVSSIDNEESMVNAILVSLNKFNIIQKNHESSPPVNLTFPKRAICN